MQSVMSSRSMALVRPATLSSTRVSRKARFVVRAEEPTKAQGEAPVADAPAPQVAATVPTPAPKMPTFGDVMAFNGAPELINGRLAMLGFVAALGAELFSNETVVQQITGNGSEWIAFAFVLFAGASLVPIFKGAKTESFGIFSPAAEMLNGRAAMIGFASLLIAETVRGSALF